VRVSVAFKNNHSPPWSKPPQQPHSKLLTACLNGYNGKRETRTEIEKNAEIPCQELFSVFS
jgi:hypothetical protein